MNLIFEWQELYLTSERSERVRYSSCHENIKIHIFELTCNVLFYSINALVTPFLTNFRIFPITSEDFPKLLRRPDERFRTFSEHFQIFSEGCRRRPKKIRRYFDYKPTNFSVVEGTKGKSNTVYVGEIHFPMVHAA